MRTVINLIFFVPMVLLAQKKVETTSSITITGAVEKAVTITMAEIQKLKTVALGDVVITNHLGEKRSEAKGLKGVLLIDVLQTITIQSESPKTLSEFYFACKANDGYTVVFSWNELFNSAVGQSVYIITEKNGQSMAAMDDSILLLSPKDFKTGRRHVKALTTIEVKRA
jgi:hypothetical protein